MKFAMLARNPKLYSHTRLVEATVAAGHTIDIINTTQVYKNITSHKPELHYKGTALERYDAVTPRIFGCGQRNHSIYGKACQTQ